MKRAGLSRWAASVGAARTGRVAAPPTAAAATVIASADPIAVALTDTGHQLVQQDGIKENTQ